MRDHDKLTGIDKEFSNAVKVFKHVGYGRMRQIISYHWTDNLIEFGLTKESAMKGSFETDWILNNLNAVELERDKMHQCILEIMKITMLPHQIKTHDLLIGQCNQAYSAGNNCLQEIADAKGK